jgi:diadenosine tetraphosphate (Ap4A) HIT family hydrolase
MSEGCLVCREVAGEIELPGGLLWDDAEAIGFHLPPTEQNQTPYLGQCLVVTRRHIDHLGELTAAEAASVAEASRRIAQALRATGVERVHVAVIGLGVAHFHQHLYPRYPGVPSGTGWMAVDALPGAPHGGAPEIAAFVARLREHL